MVDSIPEPPGLDPSSLGATSFAKARKGFEPTQVNATLGRVADALRAWELRDRRLQERVGDLEAQLEAAKQFDEGHLTAILGEETMRVLSAARTSAAEIRTKADDDAAKLLEDTAAAAESAAEALKKEAQTLRDEAAAELSAANSESRQLRESAATETEQLRNDAQEHAANVIGQAETVLEERTALAEATAGEILESAELTRTEAEAAAASMRQAAQLESDAVIEQAKEQGRQIIADTKSLREEMLRDLSERRSLARQQIDLILAGRDQMLTVLKGAESNLTATISDLEQSVEPSAPTSEVPSVEPAASIDSSVAEFTELLDATSVEPLHEPDGESNTSESSSVDSERASESPVATDLDLAGELDEDVIIDLDAINGEFTSSTTNSPENQDSGTPAEESTSTSDDTAIGDAANEEVANEDASNDETGEDIAGAVGDAADQEPADEAALEDAHMDDEDESNVERVRLIATDNVDSGDNSTSGATSEVSELTDSNIEDLRDDDSHDDDSHDDESAATATVHDLFERLRAEQEESPSDEDLDDVDEDLDDYHSPRPVGNREPAPVVELSRVERAVVSPSTDTAADEPQRAAVGTLTQELDEATNASVAEAVSDEVAAVTADQTLLDLRDDLLGPIEKGLNRTLKRLVSDEQNVILDALRRTKKQRPTADEILPNEEESATAFIATMTSDFEESLAAGGSFWEQTGGTVALPLFGHESDHTSVLEDPVREFVAAHHARLAKIFADSETEALDIDDIIDRVRAVYRDTRTVTLNEVASAVAISGFTAGELEAAEPGTPCRWVLDNGGLPCPDGEDNALAGAVNAGDPFPTGHQKPPAHRGCRCILAPIIQ